MLRGTWEGRDTSVLQLRGRDGAQEHWSTHVCALHVAQEQAGSYGAAKVYQLLAELQGSLSRGVADHVLDSAKVEDAAFSCAGPSLLNQQRNVQSKMHTFGGQNPEMMLQKRNEERDSVSTIYIKLGGLEEGAAFNRSASPEH